MSRDFWNVNLVGLDQAQLRKWEFGLAERLIRGTEQTHWVSRRVSNNPSVVMELGRRARSPVENLVYFGETGGHQTPSNVELLAIEVLRHYSLGQRTPPHLAHSFLDECMATLGEEREPVTELWLRDRGYECPHDHPNWVEYVLVGVGPPDPRLVFTVERKDKTCSSVDIEVIGDESTLTSIRIITNPTIPQVLTVGRALGIPTERRS